MEPKVFQGDDEAEVPMSPLIDCVFLLLIFFLVTTVIKRKEKQIRVEIPDTTASIAVNTQNEELVIGMDQFGNNLQVIRRNDTGGLVWGKVPDLAKYLKQLVTTKGTEILNKPLRIDVDGDMEFQKAIDTLDICTLQGFNSVSIKLKQRSE